MAKIEVELVRRIMQRTVNDPRLVSQVMNELSQEIALQEDDKEEVPPPVKKQFVILVSDPEEQLKDKTLTGWVLQIPEDDSPYTAEERLIRSAYAFNVSKKGRRMPARTIAEVFECIPAKILKEQKAWIKTKEPVLVVTTRNEVPSDTKKNKDAE